MRIGLDFDNTIAGYDNVFVDLARAAGLLPPEFKGGKKDVRQVLQDSAAGDLQWQRLQGQAYGRCMPQAQIIPGVPAFLRRCRDQHIPVHIVSHKTEFGHFDEQRVNLRHAALSWLEANRFFEPTDLGLQKHQVHFESTLADKVAKIGNLEITHFVDDLEIVFSHPAFPRATTKFLFAPEGVSGTTGSFQVFHSWRELERKLFDCS